MAQHKANTRKSAKRFNALGRAKRILNLKKKDGPFIPDEVMRQITALNLPNNLWLYNLVLRELMGGNGATGKAQSRA